METAADRYRRIRDDRAKSEPLHDVECSDCGMLWKARRFKIDFWITSGILPVSLVQTMVKATQKAGTSPEDALKLMAEDEIFKSVVFASKVVKHTAAEPRIVETPSEPNDISQEEVMTCCYTRLLNWQMRQGGEGAAGLDTFRN